MQICVAFFGLAATAEYGLSVQVINIAYGMALVWTQVKWPAAAQLRATHDHDGIGRLMRPRLWLQLVMFVALSAGALLLVPSILEWLGTDKRMLPLAWGGILAVTSLLELNFAFWGSLLGLENRIPTLRSAIATTAVGLVLSVILISYTRAGVFGLVIAPLISGMLFLYWYWPRAGARGLGTTWTRFMFGNPAATPSAQTSQS
jgi:Na+-driven multidrug efflux pump